MVKKKSKTRTPVQLRGRETRVKIIEAGKDLFAKKGYHGTNSKEIAAAAGVATGTFYSYFDDKKPLFMEIFRGYYNEILESSIPSPDHPIFNETDTREIVHYMVRTLFKAHTIAPDFHREMMAMVYTDPEIRRMQEQEEDRTVAIFTGFFTRFKDLIRIKDLEAGARLVHKTAEEIIHSIKIFGSRIEAERLLSELEDMITRYLFN